MSLCLPLIVMLNIFCILITFLLAPNYCFTGPPTSRASRSSGDMASMIAICAGVPTRTRTRVERPLRGRPVWFDRGPPCCFGVGGACCLETIAEVAFMVRFGDFVFRFARGQY